MRKFMKFTLILLLAGGLFGCVTETPTTKVVKKDSAIQTRLEAGAQYLADGNREMARRQYSEALKMDSGVAEAYIGIAQVHELNSEYVEADQNFRKALSKRTFNGKAAINLAYGKFLWGRKRFQDAVKYFDLAGKDYDFGGRAQAIYFSGRCRAELGDKVKAKAEFQHAVNLRDDMGDAHLELAALSFADRDYPQAEEHFTQFLKYSRQNARSLWLGIRLQRVLAHDDKVASYALQLKNLYGSSEEYLEYKRLIGQ